MPVAGAEDQAIHRHEGDALVSLLLALLDHLPRLGFDRAVDHPRRHTMECTPGFCDGSLFFGDSTAPRISKVVGCYSVSCSEDLIHRSPEIHTLVQSAAAEPARSKRIERR
jgi:hypothetical protein